MPDRRLAAILAADVVGYSALMAEDEAGTLEALRRLRRELFHPAVAGHRGKVVKAMGDGWLVEFGSAVDAVNCALRIQTGLETVPKFRVRIGIHVGDITHEDEDIYGDGVNVAARLEALAEPGAVMISDAVHGSLDGTLTPSFDDTGEQALKNIPRPVRIWVRHPASASRAAAAPVAPARRDFKRVMVIEPITTADERRDVQELAAALTSDLFHYLGQGRWMRATISEVPVRGAYRLTANLRARGDRLRLEAHLAAPDGGQVWADRIDGSLEETFDWQDEAGATVAGAVNSIVYDLEARRLEAVGIDELSVTDLVLKAKLVTVQTAAELQLARECYRRAIAKDPDWSVPYNFGAAWLSYMLRFSPVDDADACERQMKDWIRRGEALGASSLDERAYLAVLRHQLRRDPGALRSELSAILRHEPYSFVALTAGSSELAYAGDPQLAVDYARKIMPIVKQTRVEPVIAATLAFALIQLGRDEEALKFAMRAVEMAPGAQFALRNVAVANACLGDVEVARETARELLDVRPDFTIAGWKKQLFTTDTLGIRRYLDGLRLAGLPEGDE